MSGFNRRCGSGQGRGRGYGQGPCCENRGIGNQDNRPADKGVGRGGQPFGCGQGRCFGNGQRKNVTNIQRNDD
jgi:hypothetical protein